MNLHRWLTICAVLAVLVVYAFLGTDGRFSFSLVSWQESYYASQSEGFLRGQLSMAHEPPPALAPLPDPYSWRVRKAARIRVLWDASYFEGKYYLYFSPVPAVLLYVPVRLVTGMYPPDTLVSTLLISIAFLLWVLVLHRAMPRSQVPLWFWVLVAGIGNIVPYLIGRPSFYQIPIASAAFFTAGFAYALLRFLESKSARSAVVMGLCLALAIASRPDLGLLFFVASAVVLVIARRRAIAFLAPLVVIGAGVMVYNYARFHSPFDFGICYQLNMARAGDCAQCSLRNRAELLRLANGTMHYVFWAPAVLSDFPYLEVQLARLDPSVSYRGQAEGLSGIAVVTPFVLIGAAFAALLVLRRSPLDPAVRAGALYVLCGWVVLFSLASCRWTAARFMLEFAWPMVVGGAICTEAGLVFLEGAGITTRPLRLAIAVMCALSIVAGLLLPFSRPPWV